MKFFTRSVTQNPFSLSPGESCPPCAHWPRVSGALLEDTRGGAVLPHLRRPPALHAHCVLCSERVPSRVTHAFSCGVSLAWRLAEVQSFPNSRDLCASEVPVISRVSLGWVLMPCVLGCSGAVCVLSGGPRRELSPHWRQRLTKGVSASLHR